MKRFGNPVHYAFKHEVNYKCNSKFPMHDQVVSESTNATKCKQEI